VYRNGKWKLSKEEFPFSHYPPYESGSAYVITGDLTRDLLETSEYVPPIFIDDVYVTGILGKVLNVTHAHHGGFAFWVNPAPSVCDIMRRKIVTGTKMTPRLMMDIWGQLSVTKMSQCAPVSYLLNYKFNIKKFIVIWYNWSIINSKTSEKNIM